MADNTDTTTDTTTAAPETTIIDEGAFGSYDFAAVREAYAKDEETAADPEQAETDPDVEAVEKTPVVTDKVMIDYELEPGRVIQVTPKEAKFLADREVQKAKALQELAMTDPEEFLRATGKDPIQHLEKIYEQKAMKLYEEELRRAEEAKLSPEQKKLKEYEEKLKKYEEAEAAKKKAEDEAKLAEEQKAYQEKFETVMTQAAKDVGLLVNGKVPLGVKRAMSLANLRAIDSGVELDQKKLGEIGKKYIRESGMMVFDGLDGDALLDSFPELAERFRKAVVERAKKKSPGATVVQTHVRAGSSDKKPLQKAEKTPSFNDFWKR